MTTHYPKMERGFFHLTPHGWRRKDHQPFPDDRLETWAYESVCPAVDTKERVNLTRTWLRPGLSEDGRRSFYTCFGDALLPSTQRNVTLECEV